VAPRFYAAVSGNEAILSRVSLGFGVGIVPDLVTEQSLFKDVVRVLKVSPPLPPFEVGLAVRSRRLPTPEVRAFWEAG
jgi:LysR family positive regulator for ilvC